MKILNKILDNKKLCITIFIAIIACILLVMYFFSGDKYIGKKYKKKDYVYTVKQYENPYYGDTYYDDVPAINLLGEKFDNINTSILNNYLSVSKMKEYNYDYEYSISNNILALKITYAYYEDDAESTRYFQTIHIDLNDGKILSDDDILSKYKITKEEVNNILENSFKTHYENIINGKFYTKDQCNYDCFLNNRGITNNYLDGVSYYIQDGVLTAFKYYKTISDYREEKYFYSEDYQFVVKE